MGAVAPRTFTLHLINILLYMLGLRVWKPWSCWYGQIFLISGCQCVTIDYTSTLRWLFLFLYLGQFVKLRKAAVRFVGSVFPHRTTRLPLDGFS